MALTDKLKNIADAIRGKTGDKERMSIDQMATAINEIRIDKGINIGENIIAPNILNLFYALENGHAVKGEFMLSEALPAGESLILDSGLEKLNGLFIVNTDVTAKRSYDSTLWAISFFVDGSVNFPTKCVTTSDGVLHNVPSNRLKEWRIDGGAFYVTPQYGGLASYTPYYPGHKYIWVAW